MTKPHTLHMRKRTDQRHHHLLHFGLLPKEVHLLPLPKDVFQVELVFNVLAYNTNSKSVVHGFIEEITVELNDVRMILSFE